MSHRRALWVKLGYSSTLSLIRKAMRDTDAVSVFVSGESWADADCAIFVVKDGSRAKALNDELELRGLITPGKAVNP